MHAEQVPCFQPQSLSTANLGSQQVPAPGLSGVGGPSQQLFVDGCITTQSWKGAAETQLRGFRQFYGDQRGHSVGTVES